MVPIRYKTKTLINKNLTVFTFFLCFLLLLNITCAGGIGVAPSEIHLSNVLRGGYAETIITISNPNEVPTDITLTPKGVFEDWVLFTSETPEAFMLTTGQIVTLSSNTFIIPAKSNIQIRAIVMPPADMPVGAYNGTVIVYSKPQVNETTISPFGTSIAVGAELQAFLEITGEQLLEYIVGSVSVKDAEVGYPIEFLVSGNNNGNVRVSPHVQIDILNRDKTKILKSADFDCSEILPTTGRTDKFEISSENLTEGQYWANVTVSLGGKTLKHHLLTFDILVEGALKRKGELVRIANKVWVKVGEVVKIDTVFRNTGELTVNAKFKGEVHLSDKIISVLESDEITVPAGETVNLTTYFTPKEQGRYIVKGEVYYSKKTTFPKEGIINVLPTESKPVWTGIQDNFLYILIIVIIALLIVLLKYR